MKLEFRMEVCINVPWKGSGQKFGVGEPLLRNARNGRHLHNLLYEDGRMRQFDDTFRRFLIIVRFYSLPSSLPFKKKQGIDF